MINKGIIIWLFYLLPISCGLTCIAISELIDPTDPILLYFLIGAIPMFPLTVPIIDLTTPIFSNLSEFAPFLNLCLIIPLLIKNGPIVSPLTL